LTCRRITTSFLTNPPPSARIKPHACSNRSDESDYLPLC
jgi:hypothetical protein